MPPCRLAWQQTRGAHEKAKRTNDGSPAAPTAIHLGAWLDGWRFVCVGSTALPGTRRSMNVIIRFIDDDDGDGDADGDNSDET